MICKPIGMTVLQQIFIYKNRWQARFGHGLLPAHPWDISVSSLLHAIALYENSKLSEEETERKELDHSNSLPLTLKTFASHPRLITDVHKYICSRVNVFYLETNCSTFMKGRKGKDQKPNCCWLTWWANWQLLTSVLQGPWWVQSWVLETTHLAIFSHHSRTPHHAPLHLHSAYWIICQVVNYIMSLPMWE